MPCGDHAASCRYLAARVKETGGTDSLLSWWGSSSWRRLPIILVATTIAP